MGSRGWFQNGTDSFYVYPGTSSLTFRFLYPSPEIAKFFQKLKLAKDLVTLHGAGESFTVSLIIGHPDGNQYFAHVCAPWPDACATFAPAGVRMPWRTGRGFVVRDIELTGECRLGFMA